jgi:hypothetical protein
MSFRNSVTIVASPRPRVEKTLIARLLTDFHLSENRKVVAFDLNSGERTLTQFMPEQTRWRSRSTSSRKPGNGRLPSRSCSW